MTLGVFDRIRLQLAGGGPWAPRPWMRYQADPGWWRVQLHAAPRYEQAWQLQLDRGMHKPLACEILGDVIAVPRRRGPRPLPRMTVCWEQPVYANGYTCSADITLALRATRAPDGTEAYDRALAQIKPLLWRYAAALNRDFATHAAHLQYEFDDELAIQDPTAQDLFV